MKKFEDCLVGHFGNQHQAMKDPSRYAHINISHVKLNDGIFYGEQCYDYCPNNPYRQFILKVIEVDDGYVVQNYSIDDPKEYVLCSNLNKLREAPLQRRLGCDIKFVRSGVVYHGKTASSDCTVMYKGRQTYLLNEIELTDDSYWVLDKGFDLDTDQQVWGAKWGHLKFYRRHDIIQPS